MNHIRLYRRILIQLNICLVRSAWSVQYPGLQLHFCSPIQFWFFFERKLIRSSQNVPPTNWPSHNQISRFAISAKLYFVQFPEKKNHTFTATNLEWICAVNTEGYSLCQAPSRYWIDSPSPSHQLIFLFVFKILGKYLSRIHWDCIDCFTRC